MRGIEVNGRDLFGRNPELRAKLIELRTKGMAYTAIGKYFNGMDHSTVIYNLRRYAPHLIGTIYATKETREIGDPLPLTIKPVVVPKPPPKYQHLFDEEDKRNQGKSYHQYRAEATKRGAGARAALTARLTREHNERVARRGTLLQPAERSFVGKAFSNGRLNIKKHAEG